MECTGIGYGGDMRASIQVITLGVSDLERSLVFYRDGMGLQTDGVIGTEFEGGAVVFFNLHAGLILALYPFESIANDTGLPLASPLNGAAPMTVGHNVRTREEVDTVLREAERAGATFIDPGKERSWGGYTGHFRDPDGHLWEVVYNPGAIPEE
jgi:uncharacterized protein